MRNVNGFPPANSSSGYQMFASNFRIPFRDRIRFANSMDSDKRKVGISTKQARSPSQFSCRSRAVRRNFSPLPLARLMNLVNSSRLSASIARIVSTLSHTHSASLDARLRMIESWTLGSVRSSPLSGIPIYGSAPASTSLKVGRASNEVKSKICVFDAVSRYQEENSTEEALFPAPARP
jgi:hypothetical protein